MNEMRSELQWSRSGNRNYFVQTSDTPTNTLPASISSVGLWSGSPDNDVTVLQVAAAAVSI